MIDGVTAEDIGQEFFCFIGVSVGYTIDVKREKFREFRAAWIDAGR